MSAEILRCSLGIDVKASRTETRELDVVASTAALDGHGEILAQDWKLDRYRSNPVVLWNHNQMCGDDPSAVLPIGYAKNIDVVDGKLVATLAFVDANANPLAERVWQSIKQGSIRAVSVGFQPGDIRVESLDGKDVNVLVANDLHEISVVPVPANPEAVAITRAKTLEILKTMNSRKNQPVAAAATPPAAPPAAPSTGDAAADDDALDMICDALGLPPDSSGEDIVAAIQALQANMAALSAETAKSSPAEAIGVVKSWKAVRDQYDVLMKQHRELKTRLDERDRADILTEARAAKKLTPAMEKSLEKMTDTAMLKSFVDSLPVVPALAASAPVEPTAAPTAAPILETIPSDATWESLKPLQKHALFVSDKPRYEALKADHGRRTSAR